MSSDKNYDPSLFEDKIYDQWLDNHSFKATNKSKTYFSVVLPPPNANANSHLGHNLTVALEDISVRYSRLKGIDTTFIPGADHAGFETWVVYEKKLNQEGKTRFDFSNKELYDQVWSFVDQNKENLLNQLKKMGISCDWEKFTYTLDQKVIDQSYETFKQMWDDGLIYRGERLVNFCTFHGTSFSDIEVVYKDELSKLWYIKYPIKNSSDELIVATTRPETMLGDTAVAVNPKDNRYKKFIGKTIVIPITGREVPIVADDMIDINFGTGAVKITPAHDINDYDLAQRHNLEMISVIDKHGKIFGDVPKKYIGLDVTDSRESIIRDLKSAGALEKEIEYSHRVGHCYKCNTIIQPLLSEQWFVKMKPLATEAIKHLKKSEIVFYPSSKLSQSIEYLENIRDWNISRQIAWGIPIPAFVNKNDPTDWIYDTRTNLDEITIDDRVYLRDKDVFDTWFSSGQWPYTVLNFPDSLDFKKFYPLSLMETGGEILYQWVCRMIMLGLYITGEIPFKNVYIHGYVMAEDGSKMSKSVGNVVDPIPLIDQYGSDAVRIGLIIGRTAGVNRGFDLRKIEEGRNFANKLWNIGRFIESKNDLGSLASTDYQPKSIHDYWIINKLSGAIQDVSKLLDEFRYSEAYEVIYHFIWDDFADWYIEASKSEINLSVLNYCFRQILILVHPFAPFVTEAIWNSLNWSSKGMLITSSWPKVTADNSDDLEFEKIINTVEEIRFVRSILGNENKINLIASDQFIIKQEKLLKNLAKINSLKKSEESRGLKLQSSAGLWLDISDTEISNFINTLDNQLHGSELLVKNLSSRLSNKSYLEKAPKQIVDETRSDLENAKKILDALSIQIKNFKAK